MTMPTLRVSEVLKDKILISRESARALEAALSAMAVDSCSPDGAVQATPVIVDFEGVEGIAPSFLDELLTVFEAYLGVDENTKVRALIICNPPTRLSSKFEAVARGHGMSVRAQPDGTWLLADSTNSGQSANS